MTSILEHVTHRTMASIALICCVFPFALAAQDIDKRPIGTIEGVVINEQGHPINQALVYGNNGQPTIGAMRFVTTDEKGHFVLDRLDWGTYRVFAKKENDGYPDLSYAFYDNGGIPTASISVSSRKAIVTVRVGPRCARLRYSATDARTGRSIDVGITLRRATSPNLYLSGSTAAGEILVPPFVDVLVEIGADGYDPWPATPDKLTAGKFRLRPGQVFNLAVKLQPSDTPTPK